MPTLTEGRLKFEFPSGWKAAKLDKWSFYRNQFQGLGPGIRLSCGHCGAELRCGQCSSAKTTGIKCVDFLAVERDECCWLIEVKDYRTDRRTKTIELADEIALKVRDSLALLTVASRNANDPDEKRLAGHVTLASRIQVVLHLEQPAKHGKLFPRAIDPADVLQRLKQLLRSVDPHPRVSETGRMGSLEWSVN
jgi:hypothetical protein